MKRRLIAVVLMASMLLPVVMLAAVSPSAASAVTLQATAIRGIRYEYLLTPSNPTASATGALVKRVRDRRGRLVDAPIAGTVRLYRYDGARWSEQTRRPTDASGRFTFALARGGQYEVRFATTGELRGAVSSFPVYSDDLSISRPTFQTTFEGGNAFVVMHTDLASADASAYATPLGESGICQLLITPVTTERQPYNGPYAEATLEVQQDGTYAWGITLGEKALRRYRSWRVVTYFMAGEFHRPEVRTDIITIDPR